MHFNYIRHNFISKKDPLDIAEEMKKKINEDRIFRSMFTDYRFKIRHSNPEEVRFWLIPTPYFIARSVYIYGVIRKDGCGSVFRLSYFPSIWFQLLLSIVCMVIMAVTIHGFAESTGFAFAMGFMICSSVLLSVVVIFDIYTTNKEINNFLDIME